MEDTQMARPKILLNWNRLSDYYDRLLQDIYEQPEDAGHTDWARDAVKWFTGNVDIHSVLDVGCGSGFARRLFDDNVHYQGVDYFNSDMDMSDLQFTDGHVQTIFARHILEHSPFPVLTLMEWHRVASKYLCLVAPAPEYWGWVGKNHYSMSSKEQLFWWLERSGWNIVDDVEFMTSDPAFILHYMDNYERQHNGEDLREVPGEPEIVEYRILCEKGEPRLE